jgi:hypothetical protein
MSPIDRSVVPPILRRPFGNIVGHFENLVRLFVEQKVVVAECAVRP